MDSVTGGVPRLVDDHRWRVSCRDGLLLYMDTCSGTLQHEHPVTGAVSVPSAMVTDPVAARCMWPPVGSCWELAVCAIGGVCYMHANDGRVVWTPPLGSSCRMVGVDAELQAQSRVASRRDGRMPPVHGRVSMLSSPSVGSEREPRWAGQYDAVADEHLFVNRFTGAARRGPWVSMQRLDGCIYYLNLRVGTSRWDPPPLWDLQWVRRAPCEAPGEQTWRGRGPTAPLPPVPRGREVCGGAAMGVDLLARLRPCVRQLHEDAGVGLASALLITAAEPDVRRQLEELCACGRVVLAVARSRFALGGAEPALSLASLCPVLAGLDAAVPSGAVYEYGCLQPGAVYEAVRCLQVCLGSVDELARALLPAILAVGGFHVFASA